MTTTTPTAPPSTLGGLIGGKAPKFNAPDVRIPHPELLVVGVVAAGAVVLILRKRAKQRADQVDHVIATIAAVLHTPAEGIRKRAGWGHKAVRWDHGQIVRVSVSYPKTVVAHPKARAEMEVALSDHFGEPVTCKWERSTRTMVATVVKPPEDEDPESMKQLRAVFSVLDGAVVSAGTHDEDGQLVSFTVNYGPTHTDADEGWRVKIDSIVCSKTARPWVSQWSPASHTVTYRLRPELPTVILHPALAVTDRDSLPFGTAMDGSTVAWDLASESPHALIVGTSGSGKTSLLRTLIYEATRRGIDVMICDTKRVSLIGIKNEKGVVAYAGALPSMIELIHKVYEMQEARYDTIEHGDLMPSDLPHVLCVIDEAWELIVRAGEAWKADGNKGEAPAVTEFRSLARLGREARIHLLLGMQRPDAAIVGGETRSNFGCRVLLGRADKVARNMVGIAGTITSNARGRAMAAWGTYEAECQTYWSPDAHGKLSTAEAACLSALRPDSTVKQEKTDPSSTSTFAKSGPLASRPEQSESARSEHRTSTPPLPPRLSDETIRRIGEMDDGGSSERAIAKALGISASVVNKYKRLHRTQSDRPALRLVGKDDLDVPSGPRVM